VFLPPQHTYHPMARASISSMGSVGSLFSHKSIDLSSSMNLNYLRDNWGTTDKKHSQIKLDDFQLGRTIGKGRYARVCIAHLVGELQRLPICLKVLKKRDVLALEQAEHVINERNVLNSVAHPFIIQMLSTFQDRDRLYITLELVNGGELFSTLREMKQMKFNVARFYTMEVISAIMYLHEMLVVYRDIKPENILIHRSGHIKLTDFGFAKYLKDAKTFTLCVTPAYMAPEIIAGKGHDFMVDWWSVGILFFELLTGNPPFDAKEEMEVYRRVMDGHAQYPINMDKKAKDAITRLLNPNPKLRLGSPTYPIKIKDHQVFKGISWEKVNAGKVSPPWRPSVKDSDLDDSCFGTFDESDDAVVHDPTWDDSRFQGWENAQSFREEALAIAKAKEEARLQRRRGRKMKISQKNVGLKKRLRRRGSECRRSSTSKRRIIRSSSSLNKKAKSKYRPSNSRVAAALSCDQQTCVLV